MLGYPQWWIIIIYNHEYHGDIPIMVDDILLYPQYVGMMIAPTNSARSLVFFPTGSCGRKLMVEGEQGVVFC